MTLPVWFAVSFYEMHKRLQLVIRVHESKKGEEFCFFQDYNDDDDYDYYY